MISLRRMRSIYLPKMLQFLPPHPHTKYILAFRLCKTIAAFCLKKQMKKLDPRENTAPTPPQKKSNGRSLSLLGTIPIIL